MVMDQPAVADIKPRIVVFVRCHALGPFVCDTIDSIRYYSVSDPLIVVTVDRDQSLADYLCRERPGVLAYVCSKGAGWGAGMHRLFCEAAYWLVSQGIEFDYLINMDYDLIFTRHGADVKFLDRFDKPNVGMVGKVNTGGFHWKRQTRRHLPKILAALNGANMRFPVDYEPGAHTSGAYNILKSNCVLQMFRNNMLSPPLSDICDRVPIADDPLLAFWVACAGYKWKDMGEGAFIAWELRDDYRKIGQQGYYLFHPTKITPGNQSWSVADELECRNFFRTQRGQPPLTMEGLPKTSGPLSISL